MKLKEILEQLKSYKNHHQVIAMTEDGEKMSTSFYLYTCPIHSNAFSIYASIDDTQHLHVTYNKATIKTLENFPTSSTKTGYIWR